MKKTDVYYGARPEVIRQVFDILRLDETYITNQDWELVVAGPELITALTSEIKDVKYSFEVRCALAKSWDSHFS
jgi:hypothetical protein